MSTIKEVVTEKLGAVGPAVREQVIVNLVASETDRRTQASLTVVKKLDEANASLKKINRADNETFNEDGSVATATFTKSRLEEIKKLKETIQKLETALETAFEKSDFTKLFELANK